MLKSRRPRINGLFARFIFSPDHERKSQEYRDERQIERFLIEIALQRLEKIDALAKLFRESSEVVSRDFYGFYIQMLALS